MFPYIDNNMKKWKILIVTNNKIIDVFYNKDINFNNENYTFFNVSKEKMYNSKYSIINACDIDNYVYLGREYAESEVIYNIYNLNLFTDYEYIGILHWDFELASIDESRYDVTSTINRALEHSSYISFYNFSIEQLYKQYIILDERFPNKLIGETNSGLINCLDYIIYDYNKIFNTDISLKKIYKNRANICCSFLVNRVIFDKIGYMVNNVIHNEYFKKFDTYNKHRMIGQIIERYISIFSTQHNFTEINLKHNFIGGKELQQINGY